MARQSTAKGKKRVLFRCDEPLTLIRLIGNSPRIIDFELFSLSLVILMALKLPTRKATMNYSVRTTSERSVFGEQIPSYAVELVKCRLHCSEKCRLIILRSLPALSAASPRHFRSLPNTVHMAERDRTVALSRCLSYTIDPGVSLRSSISMFSDISCLAVKTDIDGLSLVIDGVEK